MPFDFLSLLNPIDLPSPTPATSVPNLSSERNVNVSGANNNHHTHTHRYDEIQKEISALKQSIQLIVKKVSVLEEALHEEATRNTEYEDTIYDEWPHTDEEKLQVNRTDAEATNETNSNPNDNDTSFYWDTGGLYMYAVLATTSFGSDIWSPRPALVTTFILTTLQSMASVMIVKDTFELMVSWDNHVYCDNFKLDFRRSLVLIFVSILFICTVFNDTKEALLEEAIMERAKRNGQITSPKTADIIRVLLRIRQYLLPTLLASAASAMLFLEDSLTSNEIVLNFMAVVFITDTDHLTGNLLFCASYKKRAMTAVAKIVQSGVDGTVKEKISLPRYQAVIPTFLSIVLAVLFLSRRNCFDFMALIYVIYTSGFLPCLLFATYGLAQFFVDRTDLSLLRRFDHLISELSLNFLVWLFYGVPNVLFDPEVQPEYKYLVMVGLLSMFILLGARSYCRSGIYLEKWTWSNGIFCVVMCWYCMGLFVLVSYAALNRLMYWLQITGKIKPFR